MNKIKLILLFCVVTLCESVAIAQIKFIDGDFKEALKEAKIQNKSVFIDFYTTWCQPCKMMDSKVFSQTHIGDYFDTHFISLKLDAEKPENLNLVKQFKINSYPTMIILDADGKELKRIKSALAPEVFMREVQSIGDDDVDFEDMYSQYRKNKKDFDIQQKILLFAPMFIQSTKGYERDKWSARIESLFAEYVKNKGLDDMINEPDFMILTTFHNQTTKDDKILPHIGRNYDKYKDVVSEQIISGYIVGLNNDYIISLSKKGNSEYKKALDLINDIYQKAYSNMDFGKITPYEAFSFLADGTYYLYKQRDNAKFIQTMDEFFNALGEGVSVDDYTQAIESLYSVNEGSLKDSEYRKVMLWLDKALTFEISTQIRVRLMMILADSHKKLGNREEFRKNMNIAYILSSEIEDANKRGQLQQMIKASLEEL